MLYDNALLARAYLHGLQALGEPRLLEVCRDTLDWALREMRGPEGGFYSALDADSEGVEGRFYVWTHRRAAATSLGEDAEAAIAWFGATERGQLRRSPPSRARAERACRTAGPRPEHASARERIRARLLQARERRARARRSTTSA